MSTLAKRPSNPWPDRPPRAPRAGDPSRDKPATAPDSGTRANGSQAPVNIAPGSQASGAPDSSGTPAAGAQARAAAARLVGAVLREGRSLTEALEQVAGLDQERDRPLVQELSYGTLRLLPRLRALARQLLNKPLRPEEAALEALILIGLYQLLATRIPPHAAVASTVAATRVLGKDWAAGLVNALLRRFQRERAALLAVAERDEEARWLFPHWLLEGLRQDWPEDWEAIVAASNAQPPQWLRVNRLALARDAYRARLVAAGVMPTPALVAEPAALPDAPAHAPAALRLDPPLPMARLPGYAEGLVSIQDLHAQLAAPLLSVQPGERVLDACAAPGGKTAHLLELADGRIDLTALDLDPRRLQQVTANLRRLGLRARVMAGDAAAPPQDWIEISGTGDTDPGFSRAGGGGAGGLAASHAEADVSGAGVSGSGLSIAPASGPESPVSDGAAPESSAAGVAVGLHSGDASARGTADLFDRILLDAPCSATGVIRRHPDIKWLRRPTDIEALAARQERLLEALWPLLAPGGTLLYVTCSLLAAENEEQVRAFLSRHRDAVEDPIQADWGQPRNRGRQVLPSLAGGDGFYFARLRKEAA